MHDVKKKTIILVSNALLIILLLLLYHYSAIWSNYVATNYYLPFGRFFVGGFICPFVFIFTGWLSVNILSQFFPIHPVKISVSDLKTKRTLKIIQLLLLALLFICLLNLLPIIIYGFGEYQQTILAETSHSIVPASSFELFGGTGFLFGDYVGYFLMKLLVYQMTYFYPILGVAFWFLRVGSIKSLKNTSLQ